MKVRCYLYKTKSGWHWEAIGRNWSLQNERPGNLGHHREGYKEKRTAIRNAERICTALGLVFDPVEEK